MPAIFQDNSWNRTLPAVVVFDDLFIDENVHSGLSVQPHHRQNLHDLALGTEAVRLSREYQRLVERIEVHNRELRLKERAVPTGPRGPLSIDEFCALPSIPNVDQAIQDSERSLASAREQDAIRNTPTLELINLPVFNLLEIERALMQSLPELETATLTRVQTHLASLGQGGEAWVAEGMNLSDSKGAPDSDRPCPFCAQSLTGSSVFRHYSEYFSDEYVALKREVARIIEAIDRTHGGNSTTAFERAIRVAAERRQFWSRFSEVPEFSLDTTDIVRDWATVRGAIIAHLSEKLAAPLEPMRISDECREALARYDAHRESIALVNRDVQEANRAIAVTKERAAVADSAVIVTDLIRLNAIKSRHSTDIAPLCEEYLLEKISKVDTECQRDQIRESLEQHRSEIFPQYQAAINIHLANFNADFRLDSMTFANTRGGPTCTYSVIVNSTAVPVGASDPQPGEPSFRTILSAGDRNTLALSLFFASLQEDPALASRVVIIDDPISSLDEHRRMATAQQIRRLVEQVGQVIVLSHNKSFLCRLSEGMEPTALAALEVARDGRGSTLRSWDVSRDSLTEHDQRNARLREFRDRGVGDMREVARSIRPHLEAFLRVGYPEHFPPGALLGPFICVCEQRMGTATEILDVQSTHTLQHLNEYASRYHHQGWESEPINDGELRRFVSDALQFCRR